MITVQQATEFIMQAVRDWGVERVPFMSAAGRILRETVHADRPFPPFDRVMMDGIAIPYESYERGQQIFGIEDVQAAGMPRLQLANLADCIEVMTGAVLPDQTDTVIPYEHLQMAEHEGFRRCSILQSVSRGQHVHRCGTDVAAGAALLQNGQRIGAAEIGVLATVGHTEALVSCQPRIILVATGNELVEPRETPEPYQIRVSTVYSLAAALLEIGMPSEVVQLPDETEHLHTHLELLARRSDVIICTGAVSAGRFDHLPGVLSGLGMQTVFHAVRQRPGKPMLFGVFPEGPALFALPGNPVSGFMCFFRYLLPWLKACLQATPDQPVFAMLSESVVFGKPLDYFMPVKVECSAIGQYIAKPVRYSGSGDLAGLVAADGFLELPAGRETFEAGSAWRLWPFRSLPPAHR
ncbi:molybdopterin molybdotransferase MoeA [Chitinophaga lutea]